MTNNRRSDIKFFLKRLHHLETYLLCIQYTKVKNVYDSYTRVNQELDVAVTDVISVPLNNRNHTIVLTSNYYTFPEQILSA